jgi:pimeloyl-ACP methyl ester carboxylesterase
MATEFLGPTSHTFTSQRLRLHYTEWGNPDAPPLLLIHGGRDHSRSWDWVAQALRDEWRVIAPDLRGHGDSSWSPDGDYSGSAFIYDLAQLIHQQELAPVTIVAHSLGARFALRYTGVFPETVRKVVAIEGLAIMSPAAKARRAQPIGERMRNWVTERRQVVARLPRRYASIEEALARMKAENTYLTDAQARHLTIHGVNRNEDGAYTWKYDNFTRSLPPIDMTDEEIRQVWRAITCPTLLCYGADSGAADPLSDGVAANFRDVKVVRFENAGHWLHHDQLDMFLAELRAFL